MGMVMYGTKVFVKLMGYVGCSEQCPNCGKTYMKSVVRYRKWFHLDYIPLFPVKNTYIKMCPVCAMGEELKSKEAKAQLGSTDQQEAPHLEYYSKHILANKPKGIMKTDQSYEFWMKDLSSNEEICIGSGLMKDTVKEMTKQHGIHKIQYIDVQ